jgi:hypothetical protein
MEQIFCDRRNKSVRTKEQKSQYTTKHKNIKGTKRRKQPRTKILWNKFLVIGGTNLSEHRNKSQYTREHKNIIGNKKKKTTWNKKIVEQVFWNKRNKSAKTKEQITIHYGTQKHNREQKEENNLEHKNCETNFL